MTAKKWSHKVFVPEGSARTEPVEGRLHKSYCFLPALLAEPEWLAQTGLSIKDGDGGHENVWQED